MIGQGKWFQTKRDLDWIKGRSFYKNGGEAIEQLSRESVDALTLETFEVRLDRALSNFTEL